MSKSSRTIFLACVLAAFVMVRWSSSPSTARAGARVSFPPIVRLASRNYSIEISAGPKGPVYSIHSATGEMLCENLTLGELRKDRPELFQLLVPPASARVATADIDANDGW